MVRAKFKVTMITRHESNKSVRNEDGSYSSEPSEVRSIHMSPVYGNGDPAHENTKFWEATPSGHLELGCANLEAAQAFELGKEYYVDFSPAE